MLTLSTMAPPTHHEEYPACCSCREVDESDEVLLEGPLKKRSDHLRIWKNRWFRLTATQLTWYANQHDREPRGTMDLSKIGRQKVMVSGPAVAILHHGKERWVRVSDTRLEFDTISGKTFYLEAPSALAAEEWWRVLPVVVREHKAQVKRERVMPTLLCDPLWLQHFAAFIDRATSFMPLVIFCLDWQRCHSSESNKTLSPSILLGLTEMCRSSAEAQFLMNMDCARMVWDGANEDTRVQPEVQRPQPREIYNKATALLAECVPDFSQSPEYARLQDKTDFLSSTPAFCGLSAEKQRQHSLVQSDPQTVSCC